MSGKNNNNNNNGGGGDKDRRYEIDEQALATKDQRRIKN